MPMANTPYNNQAMIYSLGGQRRFGSADMAESESANASLQERFPASAWRLLVASLAIWRAFPTAFWLDPIEPRPSWRKRVLDLCWLGCVGALFIIFVAPTWQRTYSMVTYPWLEHTIPALPLTDLWTVDKEPRLEYVPNLFAPPDALWLQERIEDLWGEEVNVGWIDPSGSEEQRYHVDSMVGQKRMIEVSWVRSSGDIRPSWQWAFVCTFKNIVRSVRLLLDPVATWLMITAATRLLVRRAPSAKLGAIFLNHACMVPVRWAWIGGLLVGAAFLLAPDATLEYRSRAYLPLLALGVCGPILLSLKPLWTALSLLHSGSAFRSRVLMLALFLVGVAAMVVTVDLGARYTGYFFFVKTGRWIGDTSNFSLWL